MYFTGPKEATLFGAFILQGSSLLEFLDFALFGKVILVANEQFRLLFCESTGSEPGASSSFLPFEPSKVGAFVGHHKSHFATCFFLGG